MGCSIAALLALSACRETPPAESAILIVVDTLRADHLGVYGYERPTSPHLDSWADRARVFERSYASSSWTLPTLGSLLTGVLPTTHAAGARLEERRWKRSMLDDRVETLAERLAAAGWDTGAVVTSPWLRPRFGLSRGFADYSYAQGRAAEEGVNLALEWIESAEEPFFLFVHLIDPHLPYDAPEPFRGRFSQELPEWEPRLKEIRERSSTLSEAERAATVGRYDEEVAYVDHELGRLFAALDARGFFDDGLLVLTSDHGEEFFEHGGFEHGHALFDEVVRVPLIAIGAGVEPGREARAVSSVDVAPSLLDRLGVPVAESVVGRSVFGRASSSEAAPLLLEGIYYGAPKQAIVEWPYKLVRDRSGTDRLYDLDADPAETIDLAPTETEAAARLARALDAQRSAAAKGRPRKPGSEDEGETVRELESLGYVN